MKNLTVTDYENFPLDVICDLSSHTLQATKVFCCINSNTDDLYILTTDGLFTIPSNRELSTTFIKITKDASVIGLEYCTVTQQLYCAYDCGDIMTINTTSPFDYEVIVQIEDGLRCMKLSPDHEMLILITATDTMICMVSTFEAISEMNLQLSGFGEKQFVTVGWGKKETQFHGSEGKAAAKAGKPTNISKTEFDDGLPRITWRGDGMFFAVSFIHNESEARQIKVFNRSGILQYTSEPVTGLEGPLYWKPSGNLIAASQRTINKHVVALFEKNGLKHREFSLPFGRNEIEVKDLIWSPDSDVLAIWCKDIASNQIMLQMWTENNCHWYLKQTIPFTKDDSLLYATWSNSARSGKKLILLTCKRYMIISMSWIVNHSRGKNIEDKSVVCVINDNKIQLTSFRSGIVPPPMAHQVLNVEKQINEIVFAPDIGKEESWINSNVFFCVSENTKLTFFKYKSDTYIMQYEPVLSCNIKWNTTLHSNIKDTLYTMHHFLWLKENVILCSVNINGQSNLCVLNVNITESMEENEITVQDIHPVDSTIRRIIPCPNMEQAYIITKESILIYNNSTADISPMDIYLKEPCSQIEVVQIDKKHILISLSYTHRLLIDGKEVANNITSFYVHSEFLLLTTLQHTLISVSLADESGIEQITKQDLTVKPWEDQVNKRLCKDLCIRRVERGSLLVVAIPKDSRVILQMPRGNLECIQPRALSLYIVGHYLNNCDYSAAFDLMRKQRINLNLIYDHDPALFTKNATKFINDINKPSWLSLFLSELSNEDITKTAYASSYTSRNSDSMNNAENIELKNKVEDICTLLRGIMEKKSDAEHYIQPILISFVKNHERQGLEAALKKIKEVKELQESQNSSIKLSSAEEALRYLLYLVDINVLFDTALGMYDFDLTMFIASKSQKDPKEYLPFLNGLKKLDENYMKYSIDMHLKRYQSALQHIAKEHNRFSECINLIHDHSLYTEGLKLFKKGSNEYKMIAQTYGESLLNKCKCHEAGIMFQKSEDLENALTAYKLANSWQDAIITAMQMRLSYKKLQLLYKELVMRLQEDKRYKEAADICVNYVNDPARAIVALCKCNEWKAAIRIAYTRDHLNSIETFIKCNVIEYADYTVDQINQNKQNFEKHKTRLALIRNDWDMRKHLFRDNNIYDDKLTPGREISDFLSDTSTVTDSTHSQKSRMSTVSGRSYRSSKNRRKQERKLLSLKEGSAFEDLSLIRALHEIITYTYKQAEKLNNLLEMLIYFDNEEYAKKIRILMSEFLQTIERNKQEIWDKSAPTSLTETETVSTVLQEVQKLIEPRIIMDPPETILPAWLDIL